MKRFHYDEWRTESGYPLFRRDQDGQYQVSIVVCSKDELIELAEAIADAIGEMELSEAIAQAIGGVDVAQAIQEVMSPSSNGNRLKSVPGEK